MVGHEAPLHEPLPDRLCHDVLSLDHRIQCPDVVPPREGVDVGLEVLRAESVVDPLMCPRKLSARTN